MNGPDLIKRAATLLLDEEHVRWTLPELARWINDGVRAVLIAKPSANSESIVLALEEGTLQRLVDPAHLRLLDLTRNIVDAGPPRVGGRIIRPVPQATLDASFPDWHDPRIARYRAEVRQYVFDEDTPREFFVYPGNDGTGMVEAKVSVLPAPLAATGPVDEIASYGGPIGLPEPYGVIVLDYVLWRAFSKDDTAGNPARAGTHWEAFAVALGIKTEADSGHSPNARARPRSA